MRMRGQVSLWDTLTLMSGGTTFAGAVAMPILLGQGASKLVFLSLGVLLGALSVWAIFVASRWHDPLKRWEKLPEKKLNGRLRMLYAGLFAWVVFAGPFLSFQISSQVMRFFPSLEAARQEQVRCVDSGGRRNYETGRCDYERR